MESVTCWVWPESSRLRWWTSDATGVLVEQDPGDPALLDDLAALYGGVRERSLSVLSEEWRRVLSEVLERSESVRLLLTDDLPEAWLRYPFEYLGYGGKRLVDRLEVIRHVPRTVRPPGFPARRAVTIVDLWPDGERENGLFEHLIEELEAADVAIDAMTVLRGLEGTEAELEGGDLSAQALLVIIAHGSGRCDRPFRLDGRNVRALPLRNGLPPLVMLLICGDARHVATRYARTLLDAGAETVLAPLGKLDARQVDGFIRRFLPGWLRGERVGALLRQDRRRPDSEFAARRLQVLGRGDLHAGVFRSVTDQETAVLAADSLRSSTALQTLIERLTLACYQRDGHLEFAVDELYGALRIDEGDRDSERDLLARLVECEPALSALARGWALPYLAYLAEVHDHELLPRCEQARRTRPMQADEVPPAPYVFHHWAKVYYRQGRYARTADELLKGFALLDDGKVATRSGIGLLGLLVNVLIDLDLPVPAERFYDRLEAGVDREDNRFFGVQRANRLDRRARLMLRLGDPERAVQCYRRKARIDDRDPGRDLAGLLYAAAWGEPALGREFAAKVGRRLHADTLSEMGSGNDTVAYLLRAYSLWAWRNRDETAAAWLAPCLAKLEHRLPLQDPGPLGLALGFLHLYRMENKERLALPRWEIAEEALERENYWLELAILNSLLQRPAQARRHLFRFQEMRRSAAEPLRELPVWLVAGETLNWQELVDQRSADERSLLLQDEFRMIPELVSTGLIPL